MKYKLELEAENTMRFYRTLFTETFHVIPDDIEVYQIGKNSGDLKYIDFEYNFKGMSKQSDVLNKSISKCNDKLANFLRDAFDREMRLQLEAHSIEIKDLLIQALHVESKLHKELSFSLVDGTNNERDLTELEKRDLRKVISRINKKEHLKNLSDKCEDVVVKFLNHRHKVKKRKLKGKKPK